MDYNRMRAQKVAKGAAEPNKRTKKNNANLEKNISKSKRTLSKLGISYLCVFIFLIVGALGGWLVNKFAFATDTFEMVTYASGTADIYVGENGDETEYKELGVKCIAFGKDCSADCTVVYYYRNDLTQPETKVDNVDCSVAGIYYAVYTCPNIKYKNVTLIRNIIVLGEEDNG